MPILHDEAAWRARAEEARAIAESLTDPENRRTMLAIAEGYEVIVRRVINRRNEMQPVPDKGR